MILYSRYFITQGVGEDDASNINAFDVALMRAEVSEVNLVPVSSILPEGARELEKKAAPRIGEIVHCVLARIDGRRGQKVAAGIARVHGVCNGKKYGLVMEAEGYVTEGELKRDLVKRVESMCAMRGFRVENLKIVTVGIKKIKKNFGSAVVALIYR